MRPPATERLCQTFQQTLVALGYPEPGIRHCRRQRLNGDWGPFFEVTNPESETLLAVIGLHTASASRQSYTASLSYSQDNECVLLSKSPNQGIQRFLFSRAVEGLAFYQIKYTSRSTLGPSQNVPLTLPEIISNKARKS